MKNNTLKKLRIIAKDATQDGGKTYEYEGLELESGEVVICGSSTNDEWYGYRGAVEAHGLATIESVLDTGETVEWTDQEILDSLRGSAREFGIEAIPDSIRSKARGMTRQEINDAIYERIKKEFGSEHASAVPTWYDGPDLDDELEIDRLIDEVVEDYGKLDD